MRVMLNSVFTFVLSTAVAWAVSISTFVCDLTVRVGFLMREAMATPAEYLPRLAHLPRLVLNIGMGATALNDRDLGGVRCRGDLGLPTVRMLTG